MPAQTRVLMSSEFFLYLACFPATAETHNIFSNLSPWGVFDNYFQGGAYLIKGVRIMNCEEEI